MEGKMDRKEIIMILVVGLLVITAIIQTVQLATLSKSSVSMSSTSAVPVQATNSPSSSKASILDNLPSMVGGC